MKVRSMIHRAYTGRLPFRHVVRTALPASVLWSELERGMTRSNGSEIWPHDLETVNSDGLELGAVIQITYKLVLVRKSYCYKITEIERGRKITYVALQGHVFEGGATVEVESSEEGSVLRWTGEYLFHPDAALAAAAFKGWFLRRFFSSLDRNIHRLENRYTAASMVLN